MQSRYGAALKTRPEEVQVRLVPKVLGPPVQVTFTEDERKAVFKATLDFGTPLSTFLRDLAVEAGAHLHERAAQEAPADRRVQWVVEQAAAECSMRPGEFMRFLALEAVGYTRGVELAMAARQALAARKKL